MHRMSGSPSLVDAPAHILPMESMTHGKYLSSGQLVGKRWLGTIALPMDASCTIVLPMTRMPGVLKLDLGSRANFCQ